MRLLSRALFGCALLVSTLLPGFRASALEDARLLSVERIGARDGIPVYRREVLSPVYEVDRIYKSMQGPKSTIRFSVDPDSEPELVWVVGYRAIMTGADGSTEASPEFMCHSNVDVDGPSYRESFPTRMKVVGNRLFTLDQGTLALELPEGFGIPVMSDHELVLNAQVLNLNVVGKTTLLRQKIQIDFIRDRDLPEPLTPLVQHGAFVVVLVDGPDGHYGVEPGRADEEEHGAGCSLATNIDSKHAQVTDGQGRRFSSFWTVEPGRHVYHTRVTTMLDLPYDTTIHYASAHLHPFAESIALRDITADEIVFEARARQVERGVGLAEVQTLSSVEGIPLHKNHEYELISTYNNTSGLDQDAMAAMLLYVRVKDLFPFDFRRTSGRM